MTGDDIPRIFDAAGPFEDRFYQISQRSHDGNNQSDSQAVKK